MNLKQSIEEGFIRIVPVNKARAKSLRLAAEDSLDIVLSIDVNDKSGKTIVRDLYECLRQVAEAKGYELGYSFTNHESIKYFLDEILKLNKISKEFDRLRKIRNGINYYGDPVNLKTAKELRSLVPTYIKAIK